MWWQGISWNLPPPSWRAHPEPALLVEDVGHVQAAGHGDAREREHHDPDQGPVAKPRHVIRLNRAQQLAGLLGGQHGGLALADFWRGAFTESAGLCSSTPPVTMVELTADPAGPSARLDTLRFRANVVRNAQAMLT